MARPIPHKAIKGRTVGRSSTEALYKPKHRFEWKNTCEIVESEASALYTNSLGEVPMRARKLRTVPIAGTVKLVRVAPSVEQLQLQLDALKQLFEKLVDRLHSVESAIVDPTDGEIDDVEILPRDPYEFWLEKNADKIRQQYPNQFLAVDVEKDEIVIGEERELTFLEKLSKLPEQVSRKLLRIHSSVLGSP